MDQQLGHANPCAFPDIDDMENFQQCRPTVDKALMTSHDEHDLFDVVSQKLKCIGAIPFKSFLSGKIPVLAGYIKFNRAHLQNPGALSDPLSSSRSGTSTLVLSQDSSAPPTEGDIYPSQKPELAMPSDNAISHLHQTSMHTFGTADVLKYEFLEENGQKSKQCILTIARPDGLARSYKSEPVYLRRADAKAKAAAMAIQMGALDFILTGDSDDLKTRKGTLLTSSTARFNIDRPMESLDCCSAALDIENCIKEWRRSEMQAEWIFYHDPRLTDRYGAALRIQLTSRSFRIYSCDSIYCSEADARMVVAREALDDGLLEYIKHGNGKASPFSGLEGKDVDQRSYRSHGDRTLPISLQSFYETLPQPFPEPFGDRTAAEINAPGYFNALLQSARGTKIKHNFYWILDESTGFFGCLLRLEREKETKTYYADRLFHKRNEAKAAACLLAFSQGLGDYIRSFKLALDTKFTPEMKRLASEKLIFALNTECSRIHPNNRLNFSYSEELDAFGCTLEIDISPDTGHPDIMRWTVPPEYRSKNDAKLAACYRAVDQGAIEAMQFRGLPPPIDYTPYWDRIHGRGKTPRVAKRKSAEDEGSAESHSLQRKRRKSGTQIRRQNLHSKSGSEDVGIEEPSALTATPERDENPAQSVELLGVGTKFNNHSVDSLERKSIFGECNDSTTKIQTPLSSLENTACESTIQSDSYYSSAGIYPIPSNVFRSTNSTYYPTFASAEHLAYQMHQIMNGTFVAGHPSMYCHPCPGVFGSPAHMTYHGASYPVYPTMPAYPPLPPIYPSLLLEGPQNDTIQDMRSSAPHFGFTSPEIHTAPRPPKVKRIDRHGTLPHFAKAERSYLVDGDMHPIEAIETEKKSGRRNQPLERRASMP